MEVADGPPAKDTVLVIDHADARVFFATQSDDATPQEPHHLLHDTDRSLHDANRSETYPDDAWFSDVIAAAVEGEGRTASSPTLHTRPSRSCCPLPGPP